MAYDTPGYSEFFSTVVGGKATSLSSYHTNLRKIDKAIGGMDEYIQSHGLDKFGDWMQAADAAFAPYTSNVRSAAKSYVRYLVEGKIGTEADQEEEATPEENAISVFKYENELQQAVRNQLSSIESGMSIDDGGYENVFPTGRSDILARDKEGRGVVVELKAGRCPKGTIEQVLGYAQDWVDSGEPTVRAIIIAGEFPDRVKAAAKRIPDLQLMTYNLQVRVEPV